jgi:uncharacterized protein (TIGR02246 family)
MASALYYDLLGAWNRRDARGFAAHFADTGEVIGFDGTETKGRSRIESEMQRIFDDHATGEYVGIVREVEEITADVFVLGAVAGIVPAGQSDIKPELNSIQRLVAKNIDRSWRIVLYQNTPAQFHGRSEAAEKLTEELSNARRPG